MDELEFQNEVNQLRNEAQTFWNVEYPNKSFEDKVSYWSGSLHRLMRTTGESGFDEMNVFSKDAYEKWKQREPNIDNLLPHIIKKLGLNSEKVYRKIKK